MTRVLITGAGGYVGSVLCAKLLQTGFSVVAIDNFYRGSCDSLISLDTLPNFEFIKADVTNKNEMNQATKRVDYIVHLAALVGFPKCDSNAALASLTNVNGTYTVASSAKLHNTKMILASTGSVYGRVDGICTEQSPLNAVSLYGQTKIAAEKTMRDVLAEDNCIIYRFATGFGVGMSMRVNLLVNDLVYQAITNKTITIFESNFRRTFIHVRDMADSLIFAIKNFEKMQGKVYNVGDNQCNATKKELAEMIARKTGCHLHFAEIGSDGDLRDYEVSYDKINKVGWKAKIGIEEGIDELIKVTPLLYMHHNYE